MRTIDFSTLLYRWLQLAGLDRSSITAATYAQFRDLANGRLETIWKSDRWPALIRITTPPGDTVVTDANDVLTVTLGSDVGEVLGVYDQDPRLTTRAKLVKYFLYDSGSVSYVNFMEPVDDVFIEYNTRKPELFGDAWSATSTYSVGAQAYFDTSTSTGAFIPSSTKQPAGNLYTCLIATTANQSPSNTPASWDLVEIPYFTGEYIVRGALSDYLRSEGQFQQAVIAESDAETARVAEVDRVLTTEGQVKRINMFTY
jgi:hypothetical protein